MRVLVTGANGQLAKTFRHLFNNSYKNVQIDYLSRTELDITDRSSVAKTISIINYDYCLNFAAYTDVEGAESEREMAYNINSEGAKNLALLCYKTNTVLVHISTDYVFDGEKPQPYKETDQTNPINVYGESKLEGEQYIQEILDKYFIIRASWLYSSFGKNFVKMIVRKIYENSQLKITTSQQGTPTSCIDLSKFIFNIINSSSNNYGIYHFSALGHANWYEFARQIASNFSEYNQKLISPVIHYKTKARRPKYSVMDINKSSRFFNFKNWTDSVNEVVSQLKNQNKES